MACLRLPAPGAGKFPPFLQIDQFTAAKGAVFQMAPRPAPKIAIQETLLVTLTNVFRRRSTPAGPVNRSANRTTNRFAFIRHKPLQTGPGDSKTLRRIILIISPRHLTFLYAPDFLPRYKRTPDTIYIYIRRAGQQESRIFCKPKALSGIWKGVAH